MNAFRDEREAMLERLHQLEEELAGVRDPKKREELLRELSSLANRVEVATQRVAEDERALDEIARSIDRMRTSIGGVPAEATAPTAVTRGARRAGPGPVVYAVCGAIVVVAGVVGFVMSARSRTSGIDLTAPTSTIPGFPHDVDPTALVTAARGMTSLGADARLTGIRVAYATANGRVDLRAQGYAGQIGYSFIGPAESPAPRASAVPLGAPGPGPTLARTATVSVTATGMRVDPLNLSVSDEGLADPECSVEQVWTAARNAGAPADAIAVIDYGSANVFDGARFHRETRWHFAIQGTAFAYDVVDPGCQVKSKPP